MISIIDAEEMRYVLRPTVFRGPQSAERSPQGSPPVRAKKQEEEQEIVGGSFPELERVTAR